MDRHCDTDGYLQCIEGSQLPKCFSWNVSNSVEPQISATEKKICWDLSIAKNPW